MEGHSKETNCKNHSHGAIDIYKLWHDKYMEDKRNGGGVFSSKVEDFEVKWYTHAGSGAQIQLRHNKCFAKNVRMNTINNCILEKSLLIQLAY